VNRSIALSAAFLDLSGGIIKTFARVFFIAPLFVLGSSAAVFPGFTTQQLQSISLILFKVNIRAQLWPWPSSAFQYC